MRIAHATEVAPWVDPKYATNADRAAAAQAEATIAIAEALLLLAGLLTPDPEQ